MSKKKDRNQKEEVSSKKEEKDLQENEVVNQNENEVVEEKEETQQESTETIEENNEYDELLKKYNELNDKHLRIIAEYDNYRKRTLKEKMDIIKSGGEDVLKNILPVIDNFERALKSLDEASDFDALTEGVKLIYNNFRDFLKQRGVTEIEAINMPLDTDFHEAIAQVPNEEQKGKIIDVVEKGYKLNDKVLRFAKVVVAQ
ncbi:MAG: nucleotide exchange factor GrpE [Bacteroidales bacterium]|nr:nucleotide exchange factor GrpE [Bacteroidales bacterium]